MENQNRLVPGTTKNLEEMMSPRVNIDGVESEADRDKVDGLAFELYKESLSVVNLASHLFDHSSAEGGGWPRNQAICAGLLIRISKFMLVVTQLSATKNRAEVVNALNRSIMESVINLEFLVGRTEDRFFDQFVTSSLGPEGELYDMIQRNIAARGGEASPIETRMLASITDVCTVSGVKIEDVSRKPGDWGGGVRERLKALGKEDLYVAMVRMPSHAVHGTWVDVYKNHLKFDRGSGRFNPDSRFSNVDTRALAPVAQMVLLAVGPYVERFFIAVPESRLLLERISDLSERIRLVDEAHENLMAKTQLRR